jgi:Uma2 family endonuclease
MPSDSVPAVSEPPTVDYPHLPGEEANPLMESTLHVDWSVVLLNAARHALAGTDRLVTGNVPFAPDDGGPHTAPDVMVIPGAAGRSFGRYRPGRDGPMPSVCIEIVSPSNTRAEIERRCRRLIGLGVAEVYVLDPERETVVRIEVDADGTYQERSAVGHHSPGLALTFALADDHLAVCCPAGRTVRPGDDPFGWLAAEMDRADRAEAEADRERARAYEANARADEAAARADEAAARAARDAAALAALEARVRALEAEREGGSDPPR